MSTVATKSRTRAAHNVTSRLWTAAALLPPDYGVIEAIMCEAIVALDARIP